MSRGLSILFLVVQVSCMEMRETVERMVMVRTSGSDLQPAATGFIYKKDNDGPASVIKMGESEVMEHLSKIYEEPKSFAASIPGDVGPFHETENKDNIKIIPSASKTIPVSENEDEIDGIAEEDYEKMFDYAKYASDYLNYKSDFDDYLKSLGHLGEIQKEKRLEDDGFLGKYDYDYFGKHYANDNKDKGFGYDVDKANGDDYRHYDESAFKKSNDFENDGQNYGFYKVHHGSNPAELQNRNSHETGYHESRFGQYSGQSGDHKEEKDNSSAGDEAKPAVIALRQLLPDFGVGGETYSSRSYDYQIQH